MGTLGKFLRFLSIMTLLTIIIFLSFFSVFQRGVEKGVGCFFIYCYHREKKGIIIFTQVKVLRLVLTLKSDMSISAT